MGFRMKRMGVRAITAVMLSLTLWATTAPPASAENVEHVFFVVDCFKPGEETVRTFEATRSDAISVAIECAKTGGGARVQSNQ